MLLLFSSAGKSKSSAIQIIQNGDEISINIGGKIEIVTNRYNDRNVISMSPQIRKRPSSSSRQRKSEISSNTNSTDHSTNKEEHYHNTSNYPYFNIHILTKVELKL
jgi:hypothetical protein